MKKGFEIVKVGSGAGGTLYSIKFDGESESELVKFYNNPELQGRGDFETIKINLLDMVEETGFRPSFFEYEGTPRDNVGKLKRGKVRLFCLRWNRVCLIAGTGGLKTTRTTQENPAHFDSVTFLQQVERLLDKRIRDKDINLDYETGKMTGALAFQMEDL